MGKTVCVAITAWILGTALGFFLCHATVKRLRRNNRALRERLVAGIHERKMGVMDKVLVLEAVVLITYTIADLVVFWHVGAEPTTLTACVFGVCGLENGVMGWIKTSKDKANGSNGNGQDAAEAPVERTEPPDVGA